MPYATTISKHNDTSLTPQDADTNLEIWRKILDFEHLNDTSRRRFAWNVRTKITEFLEEHGGKEKKSQAILALKALDGDNSIPARFNKLFASQELERQQDIKDGIMSAYETVDDPAFDLRFRIKHFNDLVDLSVKCHLTGMVVFDPKWDDEFDDNGLNGKIDEENPNRIEKTLMTSKGDEESEKEVRLNTFGYPASGTARVEAISNGKVKYDWDGIHQGWKAEFAHLRVVREAMANFKYEHKDWAAMHKEWKAEKAARADEIQAYYVAQARLKDSFGNELKEAIDMGLGRDWEMFKKVWDEKHFEERLDCEMKHYRLYLEKML